MISDKKVMNGTQAANGKNGVAQAEVKPASHMADNGPAPQKVLYDSGNELAAYAAKQINYHVMGYYPITPSTQIAENLDLMKSEGLHDISLIAAEGEHSAAGIC